MSITKHPLGNSGLSTPPLMLGGNVFGMTADEGMSHAILDRFVDAGGTLVDTADVYSAWMPGHKGGESEGVIGRWLEKRGRRDDIFIATKVGMLDGEGGTKLQPSRIAAAIDASLERLRSDYVDLYFAHQDDPDTPLDEILGAFKELLDSGKVRAIGASNFTAARLVEAFAVADEKGLPRFTVIQPELNILEREQYEGDLQKLAVAENLGVVTYFALASGYLTGKYRGPGDLGKSIRGGKAKGYLEGKGPAVIAAMDKVAAETGLSLAQIALAWNAAQPGVTAPIASATSLEQLDDLLGSLSATLTRGQLASLDEAAS